ncbi:hypothetical protein E0Z10_g2445 [Xylaria hypoxylon]|uniref:Uncharacterized protein n=1 Tax=Xylaria hypoxylon TaxID=37992 RepID=A0A4Z0ZCI2_9PEZI|nr:hypothetical protein E0Z10_g2445 [Xylaria hypoxylon]
MLTSRKLLLLRSGSPLLTLKPRSITTPVSIYTRAISHLVHGHSTARSNTSFAVNPTTTILGVVGITTMAGTPPFSDAVVQAMKNLYPEELADKSWDNTGLLLDQAPSFAEKVGNSTPTVLLTNDLTRTVVDEALEKGANVIVCYHPVIFRPLKSLTTKDPMQAQLLRLIAVGISVYCPHTAVDAAVGGLNDWLCDILIDGEQEVKRTVAEPISRLLPESLHSTKTLSAGIGGQKYLMVALPPTLGDLTKTQSITKIAVCAGSGADVLKNTDAQVLVTGEMAHHYALRHTQLGQIVVTCFHSNSERKFLEQRLKPQLEAQLHDVSYGNAVVIVSSADRDPFDIIDVRDLA